MIRVFTRQIEKLQSEDGQALVFVAMVGLVIFLFFAMTMNVAELVNTKIKNQNVADAAALSAAIWQARGLNLVAAANRNMLELWVVVLGSMELCGVSLVGCDQFLCGEIWIDPIFCIACLMVAGLSCTIVIGALYDLALNGAFQDTVLDALDKEFVERDIPDVVDLNYAFKENTASETTASGHVGVYLDFPTTGEALLPRYVPYQSPPGDYVLERVGFCEALVMAIQYIMFFDDRYLGGTRVPDDFWSTVSPTIEEWYSPGGLCHNRYSVPDLEGVPISVFPLALRTRRADWTVQSVDSLLSITAAISKVQEPPSALGKGSGAGDCEWEEDDTRFACPNARHYAFASAHAFSQSASDFYNIQMAGSSTSYPIPYVPFRMDWQPRLFPIEPYPGGAQSTEGGPVAYQDFANRMELDGAIGAYDYLTEHLLDLNGMDFFLY